MSTAADAFREIDNLAAEATQIDDNPSSCPKTVRACLASIRWKTQCGLRAMTADARKLEAFDGLLTISERLYVQLSDLYARTGVTSCLIAEARNAIAKAKEETAPAEGATERPESAGGEKHDGVHG